MKNLVLAVMAVATLATASSAEAVRHYPLIDTQINDVVVESGITHPTAIIFLNEGYKIVHHQIIQTYENGHVRMETFIYRDTFLFDPLSVIQGTANNRTEIGHAATTFWYNAETAAKYNINLLDN